MRRADRLFEIIQLLRTARAPITAAGIGERLEVSPRTVYRDIATLQAMRVPIRSGIGLGYVMDCGFDLPPLMFTAEEIEAIAVGLALTRRTGDAALTAAAGRAAAKVLLALPGHRRPELECSFLYASSWGVHLPHTADPAELRQAIRSERKVRFAYLDEQGACTSRTVRPIALTYYVEVVVLAAWCELRGDFRHFRLDRISDFALCAESFAGEGAALRAAWSHGCPDDWPDLDRPVVA